VCLVHDYKSILETLECSELLRDVLLQVASVVISYKVKLVKDAFNVYISFVWLKVHAEAFAVKKVHVAFNLGNSIRL
jgi:hypothetical protein